MDKRLSVLAGEVDEFFTDVHRRYGDDMQCGLGCSACCASGIVVSAVEAAAITAHVVKLADSERAALRLRASREPDESCAALDENGACMIYAGRPLVCRSHGVPMRHARSLPVVACSKNFDEGKGLAAMPDDAVLAQNELGAQLESIDDAFAEENQLKVRVHSIRNSILRALTDDAAD